MKTRHRAWCMDLIALATAATFLLQNTAMALAPQERVDHLAKLLLSKDGKSNAELLSISNDLEEAGNLERSGQTEAAAELYLRAASGLATLLEKNRDDYKLAVAEKSPKITGLLRLDAQYLRLHAVFQGVRSKIPGDFVMPPAMDSPPSLDVLRGVLETLKANLPAAAKNTLDQIRKKEESLIADRQGWERRWSAIAISIGELQDVAKKTQACALRKRVQAAGDFAANAKGDVEKFKADAAESVGPIENLGEEDFSDFPLDLPALQTLRGKITAVRTLSERGTLLDATPALLLSQLDDEIREADLHLRNAQSAFRPYDEVLQALTDVQSKIQDASPINVIRTALQEKRTRLITSQDEIGRHLVLIEQELGKPHVDMARVVSMVSALNVARYSFQNLRGKEIPDVCAQKPDIDDLQKPSWGAVQKFNEILQKTGGALGPVKDLEKDQEDMKSLQADLAKEASSAMGRLTKGTDLAPAWVTKNAAAPAPVECAAWHRQTVRDVKQFIRKFPEITVAVGGIHGKYREAMDQIEQMRASVSELTEKLEGIDADFRPAAGMAPLNAMAATLSQRLERLHSELPVRVNEAIAYAMQDPASVSGLAIPEDLLADAMAFQKHARNVLSKWEALKPRLAKLPRERWRALKDASKQSRRLLQMQATAVLAQASGAAHADFSRLDAGTLRTQWDDFLKGLVADLWIDTAQADPAIQARCEEFAANVQATEATAKRVRDTYQPLEDYLAAPQGGTIRALIADIVKKKKALDNARERLAEESRGVKKLKLATPDLLDRRDELLATCAGLDENAQDTKDQFAATLKRLQEAISQGLVAQNETSVCEALQAIATPFPGISAQAEAALVEAAAIRTEAQKQVTESAAPAVTEGPLAGTLAASISAKLSPPIQELLEALELMPQSSVLLREFFSDEAHREELFRRLERLGPEELHLDAAEIAEIAQVVNDIWPAGFNPRRLNDKENRDRRKRLRDETTARLGMSDDLSKLLFCLHRAVSPLNIITQEIMDTGTQLAPFVASDIMDKIKGLRKRQWSMGLHPDLSEVIILRHHNVITPVINKAMDLLLLQMAMIDAAGHYAGALQNLLKMIEQRILAGNHGPITQQEYDDWKVRHQAAMDAFEQSLVIAREMVTINHEAATLEGLSKVEGLFDHHVIHELDRLITEPPQDHPLVLDSPWLYASSLSLIHYILMASISDQSKSALASADISTAVQLEASYLMLEAQKNIPDGIALLKERLRETRLDNPGATVIILTHLGMEPILNKEIRGKALGVNNPPPETVSEALIRRAYLGEDITGEKTELARVLIENSLDDQMIVAGKYLAKDAHDIRRDGRALLRRIMERVEIPDVAAVGRLLQARKEDKRDIWRVIGLLLGRPSLVQETERREIFPTAAVYHNALAKKAIKPMLQWIDAAYPEASPINHALGFMLVMDFLHGLGPDGREDLIKISSIGAPEDNEFDPDMLKDMTGSGGSVIDATPEHRAAFVSNLYRGRIAATSLAKILKSMGPLHILAEGKMLPEGKALAVIIILLLWDYGKIMTQDEFDSLMQGIASTYKDDLPLAVIPQYLSASSEDLLSLLERVRGVDKAALKKAWEQLRDPWALRDIKACTPEAVLAAWKKFEAGLDPLVLSGTRIPYEDLMRGAASAPGLRREAQAPRDAVETSL